jgi:hypothetical protein
VQINKGTELHYGATDTCLHAALTLLLVVLLAMLVLQSFAITSASERIGTMSWRRSSECRYFSSCLNAPPPWWAFHAHVSSVFDRALAVIQAVALGIFYWVVVWAILRNLFRTPVIGADNVSGAICGYIIEGQGVAYLNALAYLVAPATYLFDPKVVPALADWHGRTALFAYYSYSHMLTIGYAAVMSLRAPATTLSLVAALFGLFHTAVIYQD